MNKLLGKPQVEILNAYSKLVFATAKQKFELTLLNGVTDKMRVGYGLRPLTPAERLVIYGEEQPKKKLSVGLW